MLHDEQFDLFQRLCIDSLDNLLPIDIFLVNTVQNDDVVEMRIEVVPVMYMYAQCVCLFVRILKDITSYFGGFGQWTWAH